MQHRAVPRKRGGRGSSRRSRRSWLDEGLLRCVYYQGSLPRSGLHLLIIIVQRTSACFTPGNSLVAVVWLALGPRRRICQVQRAGMGAPVPGPLGLALPRARRAQVAAVVSCRAPGGQLRDFLRGWRELAWRRPRVGWRLVRLLLCPNRRVGPLGWWVRVAVWWPVFCLLNGIRLRWFHPPRVAGSRASSLCLAGIQIGARGSLQPAPSSPLPHW